MIRTRTPIERKARARRISGRVAIMPSGLAELIARLDTHRRVMNEAILRQVLAESSITAADLRAFIRFDRACYTRNLIHSGAVYDLLVLCWRSGQRSPIHDHRGSSCGVKVLRGIATEVTFERSPCGLVYPSATSALQPGSVTASSDSDMHQMGNLQAGGCDLATLHVYSPPLQRMGTYFLGDSVIGEHHSPAQGMRVARYSSHIDQRTQLTEALRQSRKPTQRAQGAMK